MKKLRLAKTFRSRRISAVIIGITALIGIVIANPASYEHLLEQTVSADFSSPEQNHNQNETQNTSSTTSTESANSANASSNTLLASTVLEKLEIKGRAPKTGYNREEFYSGWPLIEGCNLRQRILKRELGDSATLANDNCTVQSGEFNEPYTGNHMTFTEKSELSTGLQIDHVVALSDAWQKGAQYMAKETRYEIATDPLNLLAVDSKANQGKSDGDAATWLPPNKSFRCTYVARQVSVKYKYNLWVTQAEHDAIANVLNTCPSEPAVGVELHD